MTRRPWMGEIALALVIAVVQVAGTYLAGRHQTGREPFDVVAGTLLAAGPAALVVRRRYPVAAYLAAFASTLAYVALGYPRGPIFFALIAAFLTAVLAGHRVVAWSLLATGYVSFLLADTIFLDRPGPGWVPAVGLAAWLLVLAAVGEGIRVRRARAEDAARAREEEARRRASEERLRIARELHDVLAHYISLINVQAGVALHLMEEQPTTARTARTALTAIKAASKEALGELRSVLDVLRQVDEGPPRSPTAGLADLDRLVAGATAAGIDARVVTEGTARPLPPSVDLAAFRIVQEALTNVTRHAGQAGPGGRSNWQSPGARPVTTATISLTYGDDDITVQVDDDGRANGQGPSGPLSGGQGGPGPRGGNGIPGMTERAAALGGRLDAGPKPGGGFRVRSTLPLGTGA